MELFNKKYSGKIVETYNVLQPEGDMVDTDSHGTHIAGTIAEGTSDNVKILPVKVAIEGKTMYNNDIITAINYITYYKKADVINMSFGAEEYNELEYQAITAANKENIICVAAAGNDNTKTRQYPASYDNTISIASVDSNLKKSDFSNYGDTITFTAPGTSILSINGTKSGTSMATPHAVSAVAVLKSYNKNLTLDNAIELLKRYSIDLGDDGYDIYYGYGLINFKNAEFYDGSDGDEFNVFKKNNEHANEILKIEPVEVCKPIYNYGNVTNLMNAKFNFYYTQSDYYTKKLSDMDDTIIEGYNPFSYTIQNIKINYKNEEIALTVDNRNATKVGWEYNIDENNSITITKFNYDYNKEYPVKIYIPEEIDGHKITRIGESLFASYDKLEKIFLSDDIIEIKNKAFEYCENLNTIRLSNKLNKIGMYAFFECGDLKNIDIPRELKSIEEYAFLGCTSLKNIEFPEGLESIKGAAFVKCSGLAKIVIPSTVTNLGYNGDGRAFTQCESLKEIIVDEKNTIYE